MPQLTDRDKINIVFLRSELKALIENDVSARTIPRLLVLQMELEEMTDTVKKFIELQQLPPEHGV